MSLLNTVSIEFTRYNTPTNVKGKLIEVPNSIFPLRGSLQPMKPSELKYYPTLSSAEGVFRFYTSGTLQWDKGSQDSCEIDGAKYLVIGPGKWGNGLISHKKYILNRVSE